jgi:capsular polysaccharide export protein
LTASGQQIDMARHVPSTLYVYGFSGRKIKFLAQFLPKSRLVPVQDVQTVPVESTLLLWGSAPVPQGLPASVNIMRLEDGFLRSVGLGADLVRPVSWVLDQRGIYYDATRSSDLEYLLQEEQFDDEVIKRAAVLRDQIVANAISKYNVGVGHWQRPSHACVILVIGQVESDASIRFGAPGINTNMGLLRAVRAAQPNAYVVYKPHPDVVAGLRAQGQGEGEALSLCDEMIEHAPITSILPQVDAVHVLTSLTGFEALLRGIPVTCYGQPFYSGWGLTTDVIPNARRTRRLTLDELVAGALLCYPMYVSRTTGLPTTAEQVLAELLAWRAKKTWMPAWGQQLMRMVLRLVVGVK